MNTRQYRPARCTPALQAMIAVAGLLAASLFVGAPVSAAGTTYKLDDIKQLDPNDAAVESEGTAISSNNLITGDSGSLPWGHAFSWNNGAMTAVKELDNFTWNSIGNGINSAGTVVGYCGDVWDDSRGFIWKNGATTEIFTFVPDNVYGTDGYDGNSEANAINNNGIVVGWAQGDLASIVPFWYDTQLHALPYLPNVSSLAEANALNNQNPPEIVGISFRSDDSEHAVAWINGAAHDLGTLGGDYSVATGVNDAGQIVGDSDLAPDANGNVYRHAFLYTPGGTDGVPGNPQMKDLGALPGGNSSGAYAINNKGQVVGVSDSGTGGTVGFVWDKVNGMQDLNVLTKTWNVEVQPNIGVNIYRGTGINDNGYITGMMEIYVDTPDGGAIIYHGYLLTPQGGGGGGGLVPGAPQAFTAKGVVKQVPAGAPDAITPNADTLVYWGQLSWTNYTPDATHGAQTSVLVERKLSTDDNTKFVQVGTASATATSYIDKAAGMIPGNAYTYRLRAANAAGDSSYSHTYTVNTAVAPTSLVWNSPQVVGGNDATGTVTMSGPAPPGGQQVQIIMDTTSIGFISVAAGASTVQFTLTSSKVSTSVKHVFGAKANNITAKASLTFTPATTVPKSISYSPNPVKGGVSSVGTIKLTNPAPAGGALVKILLNGSDFYQVTVPANATSVTYTQPTSVVTANTTYAFSASYGGVTVSTNLVATP